MLVVMYLFFVIYNQVLVNILKYLADVTDRHYISGLLVIVAMFLLMIAIIRILKDSSAIMNPTIRTVRKLVFFPWAIMSFYWLARAIISVDASFVQIIAGLTYTMILPALIFVPLIILSPKQVKTFVPFIILLLLGSAIIGIIQFIIPEHLLPFILHTDERTKLASSAFGALRVNGLVGTVIEYGLLMSIGTIIILGNLIEKYKFNKMIMLICVIVAMILSFSKVYIVLTIVGATLYCASNLKYINTYKIIFLLTMVGIILTMVLQEYLVGIVNIELYILAKDTHMVGLNIALKEISENPFFGQGVGVFLGPTADGRYFADGMWWALALDGGLIGVFLYFLFLLSITVAFLIKRGSLKHRYEKSRVDQMLIIIGIIVIGGFMNSAMNNIVLSTFVYMLMSGYLAHRSNRYLRA